jgi:hypothetical protein
MEECIHEVKLSREGEMVLICPSYPALCIAAINGIKTSKRPVAAAVAR